MVRRATSSSSSSKRSSTSSDAEEKQSSSRAGKSGRMVAESLATKYRPRLIEDMVGQGAVLTKLNGMFKSRKMPSTILLSGESGTGKTTTARLIARYINCSSPDKATHAPCGECMNCRYQDNHPDVLELNMADSRGIDDVRSLIRASKNNPTLGSNRVLILDEFHQATPQAMQALLKPLEEPPTNTIWILATTNPEKLPGTILGRCHQFSLRKIDERDLAKRLLVIGRKEGVAFKEIEGGMDIIKTVISLSNGRMRDSIQLLEAAVYAIRSGEDITTKDILSSFLSTPEAELDKAAAEVLSAILAGEIKAMLKCVRATNNARGVINKMRWLIQYLLDNAVGLAKFAPYSGKIFSKLANEKQLKINLMQLVKLQFMLIEMENRFNTMSIDENVVMLSTFGSWMADNRQTQK